MEGRIDNSMQMYDYESKTHFGVAVSGVCAYSLKNSRVADLLEGDIEILGMLGELPTLSRDLFGDWSPWCAGGKKQSSS